MTHLEKEFEKSKTLRKHVEQLVAERKALSEAIDQFIVETKKDVEKTRVFMEQFKQLQVEYMKATKDLVAQLDDLKSLREMITLNKDLAEALAK